MPRKYKTEQIRYSDWNCDLAPGHEDYFEKINTIASWIGYALEASVSGYRLGWNHFATITVQQAKEKFGEVRVYMNFATHEFVEKQWEEELKDAKEKNSLYHRWVAGDLDEENHKKITPHILSSFKYNTYPLDEPTLEEFTETCIKSDQEHYRHTYFQAFMLWPEYERAIFSGSDHPDLLFKDEEELDACFDERINSENKSKHLSDCDKATYIERHERDREEAKILCGFKKSK